MKNCFPCCFLEIIVGGQNQQGGHKPGKYEGLKGHILHLRSGENLLLRFMSFQIKNKDVRH